MRSPAPYLISYSISKLFSGRFMIFTCIGSLCFCLFSDLSMPGRKTRLPNLRLFVIIRRVPVPSYYRLEHLKSLATFLYVFWRHGRQILCFLTFLIISVYFNTKVSLLK